MRCSRCHTESPNNVSFCPNCGQPMRARGYTNNYRGNNNNKILVVLIIILALVLSIWGGVVAFMLMNSDVKEGDIPTNSSAPTQESTPTPTQASTPAPTQQQTDTQSGNTTVVVLPPGSGDQNTPAPTPVPTPAPASYAVPSTSYSYPHRALVDGFTCKFPSNFSVYDDKGTTLYTVRSSDGSGRQLIDAVPIYGSTSQVMSEYIALHGGNANIQQCGDNYFLVQVNNGNTGYYKYGKKVGSKLYSVELVYPVELSAEYARVMNDVRGSFNK